MLSHLHLEGSPREPSGDELGVGRQDDGDKVDEEVRLHGGEWLDVEVDDVHSGHLRGHCCQLLGLDLDCASGQLELDGSSHGNVDVTVGVDSSSHQLPRERTDVADVAGVGVGHLLEDVGLQSRHSASAGQCEVTPSMNKPGCLGLDEQREAHL